MQDVILLHGALGSSHDLSTLSAELGHLGLRPHSLNFSGHGGEKPRQSFGLDQFATELSEYVSAKGLKKPLAFGFSMGGYVALALAARDGSVLGKIVTLGTKFDWNAEVTAKQIKALEIDTMKTKTPEQAQALEQMHGPTWTDLVRKTSQMLPTIAKEDLLNQSALGRIKCPCLIGLADQDKMVTLDETLNVFKNIEGAGMYMLPHSKHALNTCNQKLLAAIIADFASK